MIIESVHIQNFKGIKDCNIKLNSKFNVIKGCNGKGKTSILEAITVSLGGFISGLEGVDTRHFSQRELRKFYERSGDGACTVHYELPIEVSLSVQLSDEKLSWKRTRNSVKASRTTVKPREIANRAWIMSNNLQTVLPILSYQGASRMWEQKREKSKDLFSRKKYLRTIGYTDSLLEASNIKLLINWCIKMEQVSWQKNIKIMEYEAVKQVVAVFMSYMNKGTSYEVFYDRQIDELMCQENDSVIPISSLSAGYQSLIWMVFDIAYRMAV